MDLRGEVVTTTVDERGEPLVEPSSQPLPQAAAPEETNVAANAEQEDLVDGQSAA